MRVGLSQLDVNEVDSLGDELMRASSRFASMADSSAMLANQMGLTG